MARKSKIHIEHPEAWELLVSVGDSQMNYILFTPTVANSLMMGDVSWADKSLQAMEGAVYDTPILLNEYKRVRIVVHSPHFVLFPAESSDDDCVELLHHTFPGDDGEAVVCPLPSNGVKVAYMMPRGLHAFLSRTFNYPMMCHHLLPLCEHFTELNHDDGVSRTFLNLQDDCMDLAIYRDGQLQCANTYPFTNHQDAVYYVLNAWRTHGLDQLNDELQLMGDREVCAAVTPALREFLKTVKPAEYPVAAMRLGRNAMQAPFELILMALCE